MTDIKTALTTALSYDPDGSCMIVIDGVPDTIPTVVLAAALGVHPANAPITATQSASPSSVGLGWRFQFNERQLKQIEFSQVYAADFHHGANGHNDMMLIAEMAAAMDRMAQEYRDLEVMSGIYRK